jgi:low temperature requirement protein LtrA
LRGVYWLGLVAAVIVIADAVLYIAVIGNQKAATNEWGSVVTIAAVVVVAGVLTATGSVAEGGMRAALLGAATPILLVLGYLAALSIGPPLFFAGMVTLVGARRAMRERPPSRPPAPRPRSASSQP